MIAVIIPNVNSPVIGEVVAALLAQRARDLIEKIIIVGQDQHGLVHSDHVVQMLDLPVPVAAGVARNLGLAQATAPLVLFVDADCMAEPTLVARLVEQYQTGHPVVGGALAISRTNYWALSDHLISFINFLPSAARGNRPYLLTANLLMERQLAVAIGGFNEQFGGAAGEDVDFSLRLHQRGIELFFEPAAVVTHCSSRTDFSGIMRHLARYGRAHAVLRQHHPDRSVPLFLRVFLHWPAVLLLALPVAGVVRLMAMVRRHPLLWRYWYVWPAIAAQHMAWCWGFATQLRRQSSS